MAALCCKTASQFPRCTSDVALSSSVKDRKHHFSFNKPLENRTLNILGLVTDRNFLHGDLNRNVN